MNQVVYVQVRLFTKQAKLNQGAKLKLKHDIVLMNMKLDLMSFVSL